MTTTQGAAMPRQELWMEPDGWEYGWRWSNGDIAWWGTRAGALKHPEGLGGPGEPVRRAAPLGPGPVLEGHDPQLTRAVIDPDTLPDRQQLILEVLVARARTGERLWTFPASKAYRKALRELESHRLVGFKGGNVEGTLLAWLTDDGAAALRSDTYIPPDFVDSWLRVTSYVIYPDGALPETSPVDVAGYAVRVEAIGGAAWVVRHGTGMLSASGQLDEEPAAVDPVWWVMHRFDRRAALLAARQLANSVKVDGRTYTKALRKARKAAATPSPA